MGSSGHQDGISYVEAMRGMRCWYVSTGGAVGSTFELALGGRVPRLVPLNNPGHSDEFRRFEGEANLLVWCAWRLDGADGPLTSWNDSQTSVESQLGKLIGNTVEGVEFLSPAGDLSLRFSGNLTLRIFADHVSPEASMDSNWELWCQDAAVLVEAGGHIKLDKPGQPAPMQGS
jgi:hypothetical protein